MNYMAIIRSLAIGKGRKSAGNITFRTVRGRTIVSEKVGERTITRVDGALSMYEARFRLISMFIGLHRADINVSFDKTKYGSQGNYFYKVNKAALEAAVQPLISNAQNVNAQQVDEAITTYTTANPTAIYRVRRSGYETKYMSGAWKSSDNPQPIVPPTGITINGSAGQGNAAFVSGTAVMVDVNQDLSLTITDSAASFTGVTGSNISAYGVNGASVTDSISIASVVASGNSISFDVGVPDALSGGAAVHAVAIGGKFYQYSGAITPDSGGNDSSGDGDQGENPLG